MRLYIKQKVITWRDKFSIYDEKKKEVYKVKGEWISLGNKLHIYDKKGKEVGLIREKLLKILEKYEIELENGENYELKEKITLISSKYKLEPVDWVIDGGILEHNYSIKDGRKTIADIHEKWVSWGDTYCIDIKEKVDPVLIVAIVIAVDCIEAERKKKKEEEGKDSK
ncbi:MAG: LURP-one-related/scramblase family protein [Candidatus Fimousia sp.]